MINSCDVLLSRTTVYAVRAAVHLADLAEQGGEEPVRVGDIAEALDVPRNYLSKILHQLAQAGVMSSERGPRGGFRLAVDPGALSLARIAEAVDSYPLDGRCLLGRGECSDADPCAAHDRWRSLADRITSFVNDTTLAQFGRDSSSRPSATQRGKRGKS